MTYIAAEIYYRPHSTIFCSFKQTSKLKPILQNNYLYFIFSAAILVVIRVAGLIFYMRGKKVVNNNAVLLNVNRKNQHNRPHLKQRLTQAKSLDQRMKIFPVIPQSQKLIKLPAQNMANDYDLDRRVKPTQQFLSNQRPNNHIFTVPAYQEARLPRNTEGAMSRGRENYLMAAQTDLSGHNSQQKIKLISADSKEKSFSRSDNNSAKKRGIELTKTLLKRISGMYNDKDFQNRTSFVNKSQKEETTGLTMTMSGRGVYDQYQISDFDFQAPPNHTFNISTSNHLSFNDSGNWNRNSRNSGHAINTPIDSSWNKQSQEMLKSEKRNQGSNRQKPQSSHSRERNIFRTPEKELMKVRSYNLLGTQVTADSIIVGEEPPPRPVQSRRGAQALPNQSQDKERYLIRSKNKTMEQLSLKQSMVVGFDYYQ